MQYNGRLFVVSRAFVTRPLMCLCYVVVVSWTLLYAQFLTLSCHSYRLPKKASLDHCYACPDQRHYTLRRRKGSMHKYDHLPSYFFYTGWPWLQVT
jgi:hypothetical protein